VRLSLADPLSAVAGVGPRTAAVLAGSGIRTVAELLWHLPSRWEDRAFPLPLREVRAGDVVTVCGQVLDLRVRRVRSRLTIVEAAVSDGESSLAVVWFNQPYLASSLQVGQRLWLHGTARPGRRWGVELHSPEWEKERDDGEAVHHGRIVPVYRRIGEVSSRRLRGLMARILASLDRILPDPLVGLLPGGAALSLAEALTETHFPTAPAGLDERLKLLQQLAQRRTPAQKRLVQQELLGLAVSLEKARQLRRQQRAVACRVTDQIRARARATLPFRLTQAQRRVLREIVADLQGAAPMARLLHGDVGSGKTVVAALATLVVAECGAQVAIMAPTELLAQQHHATFTRLLAPTPHRPALLVGGLSEGEKRQVREGLAGGSLAVVVGTHALFQEETSFARLGLVVIDEQHRFGVAQRQRLMAKGDAPHLLVMTATPIPRSLALTLYGDLEVSVLDELPPGRSRVRTVVRDGGARDRVLGFVRREVSEGGQAYWVVPFIEDSESLSVRAIASHAREIRRGLAGVSVGVVHGRLPAAERDQVMAAFLAGEIKVLCATTVIEVGVDVPRASVMVIENAERFGLAQLHQLRGRVGRGGRASYCVLLLGEECGAEARERVARFAALTDGFAVAEEDFRQRGPGEFTGVRQWGRPDLAAADLRIHLAELEWARGVAARWARRGQLQKLARLLGDPGGHGVGPA
jgi:ATP-dependent DNA helicase RecG